MFTRVSRRIVVFGLLILLIPTISACGSASSADTSAPASATTQSVPVAQPTTGASAPAAQPTAAMSSGATGGSWQPHNVTAKLTGSGASFPDPIYQQWIEAYKSVVPTVSINYQSVGSGQGRKDFFGGVTDFGASDKYASDKELDDARAGATKIEALHIPTVLGAVVATYNLPNIDKLQFSGPTLAGIFMGSISVWNDPLIVADNPGISLPSTPITVVHRSDGSGTTSIFTNYLSSVSDDWKSKVGAGDTVPWPVGIGGEKNPGVAAAVKQTEGAIGYVELVYALANNMPTPAIKNAAGTYVLPTLESTSAAAQGFLATLPDDLRVNIVNPPTGDNAYPIAGFTWVLVRKEMPDEAQAQALVDFLYWALTQGDSYATQLHYAPLPAEVKQKAIAKLALVTVNGKPIFMMPS